MRDPFSVKHSLDREQGSTDEDENISFEEGFVDATDESKLERIGETKPRVSRLWFLVLVLFALVSARLYFLSVARHDYYRGVAEGNRLRVEYLSAPRGTVYDRNGEIIAGNRPSFELVASPLDLSKDPAESEREIAILSGVIKIPGEEIRSILTKSQLDTGLKFESILIKQNLDREEALILNERAGDLQGFRVAGVPIRDYLDASVYAHLMGYVGKISAAEFEEKSKSGYLFNDSVGKTGLEQVYEGDLRGKFGQRQVEVDARGSIKKVFGEKPYAAGSDLILNIDAGLQHVLYDALTAQLRAGNRQRASAIAMDPRSGRILAYLSLPSFDNNLFAEGISQDDYLKLTEDKNQPLFNRTISGIYPPGSTVKPMVAAAALQEGVVDAKTTIVDRGYILIPNVYGGPDYYFYGYNRSGLGPVDARRAIALSSDIYFYSVGGGYEEEHLQGLGIDRLAKYYRAFGLDRELGIDLPGERAGVVPTPEWKRRQFDGNPTLQEWYLGDTYHVSIGQGDLLASPLHVLSWTASIANGGTIYRPFIVDRVQSQDGSVIINKFDPESVGKLPVSEENLRIVREGMRQTVTEGTARSLGSISMAVAGKTGTAQFDGKNLSRAHAWFAGFAPYDNPEIAIVVMIEDGGEGSTAAVPVARAALDWWAKNRYNSSK